MTVDQIIDDVLVREGGYVDHPLDRGACTNFGITLASLSDWRGKSVTCAEVQALSKDEARTIYKAQYIERPKLTVIPDDRLRALVVDYAVHSGPRRAIRALQTALGLTADGVIGPKTEQALAQADATQVYRTVLRDRVEFIATLLQRDATQRVFAAGWLRRLGAFV